VIRIAPSILSADFACLGDAIDRVAGEADLLHVDVMDGHFVPNLTIGPPVVAAVRKHTDLYLDCHLMMDNPGDFLEAFAKAGADGCTVHAELDGIDDLLKEAERLGLDPALAVNPETPFDAAEPWLDRVRMLLVMTVHPGFGGQSFMGEVVPKIAQARKAIDARNLDVALEVDGGIAPDTVGAVVAAGATVLVAGSAIFGDPDPAGAVKRLRAAAGSTA
jgi:ribulose-phosphate 3-epimerase